MLIVRIPGTATAAPRPVPQFPQRAPASAREAPVERWLRGYLYFAWANTLFDFHRLLGLGQLDSVITFGVLVVATLNGLKHLDRKWRFFPLVLTFLVLAAVAIPFAYNTGSIRTYLKLFFQFWLLGVATFVTLRQLRQIVPILLLISGQYLWYFAHAMPSGTVAWHPLLGDENALASQMVIGAGWCYYFGRAARAPWIRRVATLTAGLCLIGMVPAMARGATLAVVLLIPLVWLRSPKKGRTTVALLIGSLVFTLTVNQFFPDGRFQQEFSSIFEDGTSSGTGEDRWVLWGAAIELWKETPVIGLGLGNFGFVAASHFRYGELGGLYSDPGRIAMRSLHNDPVQILTEMGLLGFGTYLMMLFTFFRNGRRLASVPYRTIWARETGGALDLKMLSLAFETAMIALLINGLMYPQLDRPWFWSMLIVQFLIYQTLRPKVKLALALQRRQSHAHGSRRNGLHPTPGAPPLRGVGPPYRV